MSQQRIRVVIPKAEANKLAKTQGTRVFLGGTEITNVVKVTLVAEPQSLWKAVVEAYVEIELDDDDDGSPDYPLVYET
jgi:hypothetical protein